MKDATPIILGVAALAVALWMQIKTGECEAEYRGFREGVIYGR